jgi:hypothetical protein
MASRTAVHGLSAAATAAARTSSSMSQYNAIVKNVAVPGLQNGMDYVTLGDSDLVVSKVCMGTMNFGYVSCRDAVVFLTGSRGVPLFASSHPMLV